MNTLLSGATIVGTAGNDRLIGGAGNDILIGVGGLNHLDGGDGIDIAVYDGRFSDYNIQAIGSVVYVTTKRAALGTVVRSSDTLQNIEKLQFADRIVNVADLGRIALPDTATTRENETVRIDVLANDLSPTGNPLTVAGVTQGANGTVTLNGDGTVSFTPKSGFSGSDRFSYTVWDGVASFATTTVDVTVDAVADAPRLSVPARRDILTSTSSSTAMFLDIQAGLSDTDGSESLSVYVAGVPQAARLSAGQVDESGRWFLTVADLPGLQLILPPELQDSFRLDITATARETSNGSTASVSQSVDVAVATQAAGARDTITLKLSGDAYKGLPTFSLFVNGRKVAGQQEVTAAKAKDEWQEFRFTVDKLGSGTHNVTVVYDQDHGPRGLYVGAIEVNGKALDLSQSNYELNGLTKPGHTSMWWAGKLVASFDGASLPPAPPTAGPISAPLPVAGVIKPQVIQAEKAGDIVGFRLENHAGATEPARTITFGQAFAKGDLKPGEALFALIDGRKVGVQVEVKATHEDGSVRHAILSLDAPALAARAGYDVMLRKGGEAPPRVDLTAGDVLKAGYDLQLRLNLEEPGGNRTVTVDAAALLAEAIRTGKVDTWISGPTVSEFRVGTWIDENLRATFDIRVHRDGTVRTDVILSNDNGLSNSMRAYRYDVDIIENGKVVQHFEDLNHFRNTRWHEVVWQGGEPGVHIVRDAGYLMDAGAIAYYDQSQGVNAAAIVQQYQRLLKSDTGPMGSGLIMKEMPAAGGRPDIAPEMMWTAQYLLSQDPRAEKTMLALADVAGSVPWHFLNPATGRPMTIDDFPNQWIAELSKRGATDKAQWNGWQLDNAHQPALSYVPYLITGDRYHLDNLQMQASSALMRVFPWDRVGNIGLIEHGEQVRGLAWTLRTLADAAYISPDNDPLNRFFDAKLANNLNHMVKKFVTDGFWAKQGVGETEGFFMRFTGGHSSPWQNDFVSMVLAKLVERGDEQARTLMEWMDNFISGRFLQAENGADPIYATNGGLIQITTDGRVLSTWKEVFDATIQHSFPTRPAAMPGFPDQPIGYVAVAKASLASMISATGSPDAVEAYGYVQSQSAHGNPTFASDPSYAIVPRLSDGSYLEMKNIRVWTNPGNANMTGSDANELIHGGPGNDVIQGGGGIDMLFGGEGNDVIHGGPGDDFLFGGPGNDRLIAGPGSDYLKGGSGADMFVFDSPGAGRNTVADFTPGADMLEIRRNLGGNGLSTAEAVLKSAQHDGQGNTLIDLGQGQEILLLGIRPDDLPVSSIHMS